MSDSRPVFEDGVSCYIYATEAEVLEFANKVRRAGGADVLEALMPSKLGDAENCLIANALNFSCSVDYSASLRRWTMDLPLNMTRADKQALATAVECAQTECGDLILPEHIGNAAYAFDRGEGWTTKYQMEKNDA